MFQNVHRHIAGVCSDSGRELDFAHQHGLVDPARERGGISDGLERRQYFIGLLGESLLDVVPSVVPHQHHLQVWW